MRNHKSRRFRFRSNGRNYQGRDNGIEKMRSHSNSFVNDRSRGNFKPQQSPEKLAEKYNTLAKEALSSGDKISSENFLQHADHFMRIIEFKNLNQKQNKAKIEEKPKIPETQTSGSSDAEIKQDIIEKEE